MDADATDQLHMRRAVELSLLGLGETSPNPNVGCVLVGPGGAVVGEGRTAPAGGPHAEVNALAAAGELARRATAYVTLEPCDHTGRTGPCTQALIEAGVARVVVAVRDPNPQAAGGAETLRAAGVTVDVGADHDAARDAMIGWLTAVGRGTPYVIWKFAATLDGRSAAADGTSKWITSPQARADVHRIRGGVDAIIAGIGTVLADDPQLTVRTPTGPTARRPLRVVVDGAGRTPPGARVLDDAAATWVVTSDGGGRVDLPGMLRELYDRGVRTALLEGGPTLAGAFLAEGLIDRVVAYLAPKLLGAGPAALAGAGISTIAEALTLDVVDLATIGPDVRLTATVKGA
ncbi:bifunctional diaminohydroxyphosphoribosylaminopyrimidine deaminase/5-amino-6-(5-phosphoribosylamino)uracil reductase RibD [Dactylosporangium sp. NBC_01737]|uniref:bifunctional diaminohydroxyphosphoribosylaminopyrimidine deaminase/5-amino-6-(5-phosphoribosylamino)uracil reductase RibD n=1 Tax=Dactylosporangium sp. NBC_01737 TaxID=2975959 RepID=UPI002E0EA21A|nr:bifunctional diaminohydroxyphosphoribosylaminopyrimidine deaminase/5-amino-6-(5-phosphoribosylamino)uracil reductase RibD [Dactylosporangium sp. NBC_01737]